MRTEMGWATAICASMMDNLGDTKNYTDYPKIWCFACPVSAGSRCPWRIAEGRESAPESRGGELGYGVVGLPLPIWRWPTRKASDSTSRPVH